MCSPDLALFTKFAKLLQGKDNYRIDTLADDIACLVKALGHDSCILVGHDWGGVSSWVAAHAHSSVIDKLIIICAPHPKCEFDWDQYIKYVAVARHNFKLHASTRKEDGHCGSCWSIL